MTTNKMTRRGFLGLGAAAGVLAAGTALAGCSPKKRTEEESKEPVVEEPDTIDESLIADTVDCDVVVCGLGVSGVAALRAAAESGAKVVGVEKTSKPNCRSNMFAAFNCDTARQLGVEDIDPTEIANELMTQMAHRGDYRVINKWLANCGEAFEWYVGAYDGLLMVGPEDEYPEDLELNERGQRFCNEDLSMTNIAKVMVNQPGSKVFQIMDATAEDYYPVEMMLGFFRGDGEMFSAEANTLEDLAAQLGFIGEDAQEFMASVERYNELCTKGHDDDFGKAAEKMHAIATPPFKAITYDMLKHTSVLDVSCMRLLVTMGGLVTNDNAQVLDDDLRPIAGLYAVGNTQGCRFVDDYPFSLSGASHGAALTYGYLAGKHVAQQ